MAVNGGAVITDVGNSTPGTGSAVTSFTPSAIGTTLAGDLLVVISKSTSGDLLTTPPRSTNGTWVFPAYHYDSTNGHGLLVAVCIAARSGAAAHGSITVPSMTHTFLTQTYRLSPPFQWDLPRMVSSGNFFFDSASGVAADAPELLQSAPHGLDIVVRGFNNGGATITLGAMTGFTNRTYTSNVANQQAVGLDDRELNGMVSNPAVSSNLSANGTMRMGLRFFVPVIGDAVGVAGRNFGAYRRMG